MHKHFTGVPPDVMHDILEGSMKLELKCLLYTYIKEKPMFTLSLLNERIRNLNYGPDCSDHPPSDLSDPFLSLSPSSNFKLTAYVVIILNHNFALFTIFFLLLCTCSK